MLTSRVDASGRPIKQQLYFLVLAAVLPLFLVFAYDIYQETRDGFERARGAWICGFMEPHNQGVVCYESPVIAGAVDYSTH